MNRNSHTLVIKNQIITCSFIQQNCLYSSYTMPTSRMSHVYIETAIRWSPRA